jgi:hypothetical protein
MTWETFPWLVGFSNFYVISWPFGYGLFSDALSMLLLANGGLESMTEKLWN